MNIAMTGQVPDFRISPFPRELALHYTPYRNLTSIIEHGALLPHRTFSDDRTQRPIILFTVSRFSVVSMLAPQHGNPERWLRFGYDGHLLPVSSTSFMMSTTPAASSKEEGLLADSPRFLVDEWRMSLKPITVEEFALIQASDDSGKTWRTLHVDPNAYTNPKGAAGRPLHH